MRMCHLKMLHKAQLNVTFSFFSFVIPVTIDVYSREDAEAMGLLDENQTLETLEKKRMSEGNIPPRYIQRVILTKNTDPCVSKKQKSD